MSAQFNDVVVHEEEGYAIAGIAGERLFDPRDHGITPKATSSACWRGYCVTYAIEDGKLLIKQVVMGLPGIVDQEAKAGRGPVLFEKVPDRPRSQSGWVYSDLREPVRFTGTLLLAREFIPELLVHMGFHPAWKYREVRQVVFEDGRVTGDRDVSEEMARIRQDHASENRGPDFKLGMASIPLWIDKCFSRGIPEDMLDE